MTRMAVAERMSAEEYMALPEQKFTNLVEGEVVVAEPTPLHQVVVGEVFAVLRDWSRAGPARGQATLSIDVALDEHNVYSPDVLWYRADRAPGRTRVRPQPVPDLAVEVRSPSTWRHDIGPKKAHYERQGLAELWLVDTEAEVVIVFRRSAARSASFDVSLELGRDQSLLSPLLPGFALDLGLLFPAG